MPNIESVKRGILTECREDYVGLWSVIRDVEDAFPKKGEAALRSQVLELLHDLLVAREIKAGFPTGEGTGFRSLRVSPEKIIERIEADWPVGHRPTIGEGLWFTRAKRGAQRSQTR